MNNLKSIDSSIILQAYNWNSWRTQNKSFFKYLASKSSEIKEYGIDSIWLPPCSKSVSPQGYMPLNLYDLNSEYGTETELKNCVKSFRDKDMGVYADIVINHRCAEFQNKQGIYNVFGGKLPWDETAIVSNDIKFQGKGNHSNYKLFNAAPNIDHSQKFVKDDLIQWILWLKNDIGFNGFRFDFMTGIDPQHMKEYFKNIDVDMCIGEYWDNMEYNNEYLNYNQNAHRQRIIDWIDNSGKHSYAFDMTTKGILQEALKNKEYWRLADENNQPAGLIGWWKEKSVTFLDNHDTHHLSQDLWSFPQDHIVEGYAYILTHPGIPMIYWDDLNLKGLKEVIVLLIKLRKEANINACSNVEIVCADDKQYSAIIDKKTKITIGMYNDTENFIYKTPNVLIQNI